MSRFQKIVAALLATLIVVVGVGVVVFVNVSHQAGVAAKEAECQSIPTSVQYFYCMEMARK